MIEAKVYNKEGKETGKIKLPEHVFDAKWRGSLVRQVVLSYQANKRAGVAHAKDRSEVRGGGKKPWRQKGTGRARHGSIRSPIWTGGGVTHGPLKEKNYSKKINKKMKKAALFSVLSKKLSDGEIIFVDTLSFDAPKTKEAKNIVENLSTVKGLEKFGNKKRNAGTLVLPEADENVFKSFRNLGNIEITEVRNMNALNILKGKYVVIVNPEKSLPFFGEEVKIAKKAPAKKSTPKKESSKSTKKSAGAKKVAKKSPAKPKTKTSKK